MCEFLSLGLIDTILSFVIFSMNIIYTVWGWFIPNDPNRDEFNEHMEKLKSYLNFVTYSDSLVLPIKIIVIVLIQYVLCRKNKGKVNENVNENKDENKDENNNNNSSFPNFLKMNVSRKKNIVEV